MLPGALRDRIAHHVRILEMNRESYRRKRVIETEAGKRAFRTRIWRAARG